MREARAPAYAARESGGGNAVLPHSEIEAAILQGEPAGKLAADDWSRNCFLSTLSHEIRTPLNAVIGFSELLRAGEVSSHEQHGYLEAIHVAGNSLLVLFNEVLDLAKLEAGRLDVTSEPTDLASLLEEIRIMLAVTVRERGLRFHIDGCEGLPEIYFDPARMRQVLFNLVGIMIRLVGRGGMTLKVGFTCRSIDSGLLTIEVIGSGEEISSAVRRDGKFGMPEGDGIGIGLAVARRLAEQMGGNLSCGGGDGRSSTFTVWFDDIRYVPFRAGGDGGETEALVSPFRPLRILLVDDVRANLRVFEAVLRRFGFQPVCVSSAGQALEAIAGTDFDVVMTDLWMPGMNGAELAGAIRDGGKSTALVAVTADLQSSAHFDMNLFDAVLTKPVNAGKVREILEEIQRRNLR